MPCKAYLLEAELEQAVKIAELMASRGPIEGYSTCNVQDIRTAVCTKLSILRTHKTSFHAGRGPNWARELAHPSPTLKHRIFRRTHIRLP